MVIVPCNRFCFDRTRAITPFNHLLDDHSRAVDEGDPTHIEEFLTVYKPELFPALGRQPSSGVATEAVEDCRGRVSNESPPGIGAGTASRTPDLRITNALLYQLSYAGNQSGRKCTANLFLE